jgi:hypothetical protein
MFHRPEYVIRHWSTVMPVVSWTRGGNLGFQDTVVLRRGVT